MVCGRLRCDWPGDDARSTDRFPRLPGHVLRSAERTLSNFTSWLTSFLSGSKRVLELLDMPLTIAEPTQPVEWQNPQGAIRFNHVAFGYDPNQPVLKDISFEVRPGEMVGIVGRSGSGKTTMVNLLSRFYDVQEGSITIDGIDIRHLSMHQLREHLGIVFQESFLFPARFGKTLVRLSRYEYRTRAGSGSRGRCPRFHLPRTTRL